MSGVQTIVAAKAVGEGDGEMTNDEGGTESAVLLESWSDAEGQVGLADDMRMGAVRGAGFVVGKVRVGGWGTDRR